MVSCSMLLCHNTSKKNKILSFFKFPKDLEGFQQWTLRSGRSNLDHNKLYRVCEVHFKQDEIILPQSPSGRKRLINTALPTMVLKGKKIIASERSSDANIANVNKFILELQKSIKRIKDGKEKISDHVTLLLSPPKYFHHELKSTSHDSGTNILSENPVQERPISKNDETAILSQKPVHERPISPNDDDDDEINIISENTVCGRPMSTRKSGVKVKKITSLLTPTALRFATDPIINRSFPEILADSSSLKGGKKINWPPVVHLPESLPANSSEMENKLFVASKILNRELDKNMDHILSQKTRYERLLYEEKQKVSELEEKVKLLENEQSKIFQIYEFHLQEQQKAANLKEVEWKEMVSKVKLLETKNDEFAYSLAEERRKLKQLKIENNKLIEMVSELPGLEESPQSPCAPPPSEINFTGEKFKDFLDVHLLKEKNLQDRVGELTIELERRSTAEGQRNRLMNLAARHLNHLHLSWLKWILNLKQKRQEELDDRLREFAFSIYEASESAYVLCAKAFGLPSLEIVRSWKGNAASAKVTTTSIIEALYEEGEQFTHVDLIKLNADSEDKQEIEEGEFERSTEKRKKFNNRRKISAKRIKDKDEYDEGKVSDEDEEIFLTDSETEEEEDEEEFEEIIKEEEEIVDENEDIQKAKENILFSPKERKVENLDIIFEDEDLMSRHRIDNIDKAKPLLEPKLPIASTAFVNTQFAKTSSKEKGISLNSSFRSRSKVFRIIK